MIAARTRTLAGYARYSLADSARFGGYFRTPRTQLLAWNSRAFRLAGAVARRLAAAPWAAARAKRVFDRRDFAFLYVLIRGSKPKVAVETGVEFGVGSAAMLLAMADNRVGHLHSIDLPTLDSEGRVNADGKRDRSAVPTLEATGYAIPPEARDRWTIALGSSAELLPPLLERLGTIDLFFHDSEHSYSTMLWEFRTAWPHLTRSGLLASDDVGWNAAFTDFCRSVDGAPLLWPTERPKKGVIRKP